MFGRIILVVTAGLLIAGGAWKLGYLPIQPLEELFPNDEDPPVTEAPAKSLEIGNPLYAPKVFPPTPPPAVRAGGPAPDPVTIGGSRLVVMQKEEVPSQRDGVILFIGTDILPGEVVPPDRLINIEIGGEKKQYRKLKEGDLVVEGQLLAILDDRVARDELGIKRGEKKVAEAETEAAEKTRDEAKKKWDTAEKLFRTASKAISPEDVRAAELTYVRYLYEAVSKKEAIGLGQLKINQATTVLGQHEIRSSIPGIIKTIYKNPGEAVKSAPSYEPVFQIQNVKRMRVEGLVDLQHLRYLRPGDPVAVEVTSAQGAEQMMIGHLQEVTGVAVSNHSPNPLIVSSSLDGTVRVWDRVRRREARILRHPGPVRSVSCTPLGAKANWCASGSADGSIRLWDLNSPSPEPLRTLEGKHRGSINTIAFSPDGATLATGGDDREICLWDAATGALKYKLTGP